METKELARPEDVISDIKELYGEHFFTGFLRAKQLLTSIRSFDDVETILMRGHGLSDATYRSYMSSVRQLYEFTGGLIPTQVTPGHIEKFYDEACKRVERVTAYNQIQGLKRFFKGVAKLIPGYISPFEVMEPALVKKLNRSKKAGTKPALNLGEFNGLLDHLRELAERTESPKHLENFALVYMLGTSGLRASELCQLKWKNLDLSEGRWQASFVQKGGSFATQELYGPSVDAARAYFVAAFDRLPEPEDPLFQTIKSFPGDPPRSLNPRSLWDRIKRIGNVAKAPGSGCITRDLNFSPHLFRRTFASLLYKSGMKLKAIQGLTRHANIEVLAKHYIDDREPASPYFDRVLQGA